jgi:hypothetical protein
VADAGAGLDQLGKPWGGGHINQSDRPGKLGGFSVGGATDRAIRIVQEQQGGFLPFQPRCQGCLIVDFDERGVVDIIPPHGVSPFHHRTNDPHHRVANTHAPPMFWSNPPSAKKVLPET